MPEGATVLPVLAPSWCECAGSQARCDLDAERDGDDSSGSLGGQGSPLAEGTLGATARALMARGRKLSTIYSRVSAVSGGSSFLGVDSQVTAAQCLSWQPPVNVHAKPYHTPRQMHHGLQMH